MNKCTRRRKTSHMDIIDTWRGRSADELNQKYCRGFLQLLYKKRRRERGKLCGPTGQRKLLEKQGQQSGKVYYKSKTDKRSITYGLQSKGRLMDRASAIRVGHRRTNGTRSKEVAELSLQSAEIRRVSVRVVAEDALKHCVHMSHVIGIQRRGRGTTKACYCIPPLACLDRRDIPLQWR